jgi:hypothetical protein
VPDASSLAASGGAADPLWRRRWLLLASSLMVLVALAVLEMELSFRWHWALFGWGFLVGVVGAAGIHRLGSTAIRLSEDPDRTARFSRRRALYTWAWFFLGTEAGMLAAMFDLAWIDIAVAVYVAVLLVAVVTVLRIGNRRQAAS